ncbi:hypothetical protein B0J11DRAFT_564095 [Dendryphion nanum]|uniref:DUF7704 domain-containing protein n=1 Tax=Dendryphion nanum TaxID=256645 RepID=A0A9P9EKE7_9PLEO|nr:hypothetical protein B0J11DRAFT_564095 [Dendryphion nanum]
MALGTILPFWPALLFTYIEPLSLLLGWNDAWNHAPGFVTRQLPATTASALIPAHPGALILSYSVGNVFLVLAGIAIVCTAITREPSVAKGYLLVIALGDLGHIYASYKQMGPDVFWNFGGYNDLMWGNIGASAFLHVNRLATVLGVFGRVGRRN